MAKIESVGDVLHWISNSRSDVAHRWWRGHSKAKWSLVPKAFRPQYDPDRERALALRFKRKARTRRGACPDENDHSGWLCLMQHYGLPTRLLDWSESVAVALYFAVFENSAHDGALWALAPGLLDFRVLDTQSVVAMDHPKARPYFEEVFAGGPRPEDDILAVMPTEIDLRMLFQRSVFTIHRSECPLETLVWKNLPGLRRAVYKFVVPSGAKSRLKDELTALGIYRSTLFPELDNLAKDLDERTPAMWADDSADDW